MKTNDEILKYLAGLLSEEEKREFELRMENSPSLRKELERKASYLKELKALGSVEADTHYFEQLLPQLRQKKLQQKTSLGKKRTFRLYPRLAYIVPILAVIAFLLFKPSPYNPTFKKNTAPAPPAELTREVSRMNEQTKRELAGSLMENETGTTIQPESLPDNAAEAVENTLGEELYAGSDSKAQYIDTDELMNSISNDEAEDIYQAMINKKIL
ncbi:MAG: hypothetical protein HF314_15235 [Ignavibacteria bacterium]|jgi:hypothetical protein|nr:hypothetical protein [Ignavibacteria bacterium]MCU7504434.1 hypothetical protein [Ignavibacteria bacterium]MCU7517475.1 hypothetical protein [Ignavibacteria bacterium]